MSVYQPSQRGQALQGDILQVLFSALSLLLVCALVVRLQQWIKRNYFTLENQGTQQSEEQKKCKKNMTVNNKSAENGEEIICEGERKRNYYSVSPGRFLSSNPKIEDLQPSLSHFSTFSSPHPPKSYWFLGDGTASKSLVLHENDAQMQREESQMAQFSPGVSIKRFSREQLLSPGPKPITTVIVSGSLKSQAQQGIPSTHAGYCALPPSGMYGSNSQPHYPSPYNKPASILTNKEKNERLYAPEVVTQLNASGFSAGRISPSPSSISPFQSQHSLGFMERGAFSAGNLNQRAALGDASRRNTDTWATDLTKLKSTQPLQQRVSNGKGFSAAVPNYQHHSSATPFDRHFNDSIHYNERARSTLHPFAPAMVPNGSCILDVNGLPHSVLPGAPIFQQVMVPSVAAESKLELGASHRLGRTKIHSPAKRKRSYYDENRESIVVVSSSGSENDGKKSNRVVVDKKKLMGKDNLLLERTSKKSFWESETGGSTYSSESSEANEAGEKKDREKKKARFEEGEKVSHHHRHANKSRLMTEEDEAKRKRKRKREGLLQKEQGGSLDYDAMHSIDLAKSTLRHPSVTNIGSSSRQEMDGEHQHSSLRPKNNSQQWHASSTPFLSKKMNNTTGEEGRYSQQMRSRLFQPDKKFMREAAASPQKRKRYMEGAPSLDDVLDHQEAEEMRRMMKPSRQQISTTSLVLGRGSSDFLEEGEVENGGTGQSASSKWYRMERRRRGLHERENSDVMAATVPDEFYRMVMPQTLTAILEDAEKENQQAREQQEIKEMEEEEREKKKQAVEKIESEGGMNLPASMMQHPPLRSFEKKDDDGGSGKARESHKGGEKGMFGFPTPSQMTTKTVVSEPPMKMNTSVESIQRFSQADSIGRLTTGTLGDLSPILANKNSPSNLYKADPPRLSNVSDVPCGLQSREATLQVCINEEEGKMESVKSNNTLQAEKVSPKLSSAGDNAPISVLRTETSYPIKRNAMGFDLAPAVSATGFNRISPVDHQRMMSTPVPNLSLSPTAELETSVRTPLSTSSGGRSPRRTVTFSEKPIRLDTMNENAMPPSVSRQQPKSIFLPSQANLQGPPKPSSSSTAQGTSSAFNTTSSALANSQEDSAPLTVQTSSVSKDEEPRSGGPLLTSASALSSSETKANGFSQLLQVQIKESGTTGSQAFTQATASSLGAKLSAPGEQVKSWEAPQQTTFVPQNTMSTAATFVSEKQGVVQGNTSNTVPVASSVFGKANVLTSPTTADQKPESPAPGSAFAKKPLGTPFSSSANKSSSFDKPIQDPSAAPSSAFGKATNTVTNSSSSTFAAAGQPQQPPISAPSGWKPSVQPPPPNWSPPPAAAVKLSSNPETVMVKNPSLSLSNSLASQPEGESKNPSLPFSKNTPSSSSSAIGSAFQAASQRQHQMGTEESNSNGPTTTNQYHSSTVKKGQLFSPSVSFVNGVAVPSTSIPPKPNTANTAAPLSSKQPAEVNVPTVQGGSIQPSSIPPIQSNNNMSRPTSAFSASQNTSFRPTAAATNPSTSEVVQSSAFGGSQKSTLAPSTSAFQNLGQTPPAPSNGNSGVNLFGGKAAIKKTVGGGKRKY